MGAVIIAIPFLTQKFGKGGPERKWPRPGRTGRDLSVAYVLAVVMYIVSSVFVNRVGC